MQIIIAPNFTNGDLAGNAIELCELFQLAREEDVPIERFAIVYDGKEHLAEVGPGKYKSALFLLYCMTKSATPAFRFTPEMLTLATDYFGDEIMRSAVSFDTKHTTVHALLGHTPYVRLTLKPGYRSCMAAGRTIEEVIAHGWNERAQLGPQAKAPFLRLALEQFFRAVEAKILVMSKSEQGPWPTPLWADRALELQKLLGQTATA